MLSTHLISSVSLGDRLYLKLCVPYKTISSQNDEMVCANDLGRQEEEPQLGEWLDKIRGSLAHRRNVGVQTTQKGPLPFSLGGKVLSDLQDSCLQ